MHHFEEAINGRVYRIEVSHVGPGRWRAQITRTPGGSAALMPFYGETPDAAAAQLSRWLSLAHGATQVRADAGVPPPSAPAAPGASRRRPLAAPL